MFLRISLIVFALFAITACGHPTVLAESTPRPSDMVKLEAVRPPTGTLKIPAPDVSWTPVIIGSGLGGGLVRALLDRESVAIVLQNGAPALLEDRAFQMVKASSSNIKVLARGRATLDSLLEERGEIPYRITLEPAGTDIMGRPFYLPKEHPLNTEWLARKGPLKGAESMLTIRQIAVDDRRLRQLREGRIGSCEEYEKDLQAGLDSSAEFFKPYSERVDNLLTQSFSLHLKFAIPFWREELKKWNDKESEQCAIAYSSLIDQYESCLNGPCGAGPGFFHTQGGIIGIIDNTMALPKSCPVKGMRDYAAEIEDLAARAVADVLPALDIGWAKELIKIGALEKLRQGVSKACAPRRRRIDANGLSKVSAEIKEFLQKLSSQNLNGEWSDAKGMERIPGVGPIQVLARVKALGYDPSNEASAILNNLQRLDKCDEGPEKLYQAALIDIGTSEVVFMGIFFEEELLCEGMPPSGEPQLHPVK